MSKNTQSLQKMSTMSGYLSEVFSEELCLPRGKLELKKKFYTERNSTVMF